MNQRLSTCLSAAALASLAACSSMSGDGSRSAAGTTDVDTAVVVLPTVGAGEHAVEVDLMQPLHPGQRPRVDEPALNHVGLWIDDLPAAHAWLAAHGVRFAPGGIRRGANGHDVCFIHPKGSDDAPQGGEGVLIELVQAPRG